MGRNKEGKMRLDFSIFDDFGKIAVEVVKNGKWVSARKLFTDIFKAEEYVRKNSK